MKRDCVRSRAVSVAMAVLVLANLMLIWTSENAFAFIAEDFAKRGSVGFYSQGYLESDAAIDGKEAGLLKLFVERDRRYGNEVMIDTLKKLGAAYVASSHGVFERIQIGDIAQYGGGPITRHASHQTGLDADIVFLRRDHRETDPSRGFNASFDELFVSDHRVTSNFDTERMWWVFRWLNRTRLVDRIFVDPQIKRHFCNLANTLPTSSDSEKIAVLRQLRPLAKHDDHFHLRLKCPPQDTECEGSVPVKSGSGCSELYK